MEAFYCAWQGGHSCLPNQELTKQMQDAVTELPISRDNGYVAKSKRKIGNSGRR